MVRWLILPVIGPAVIAVYFSCMWLRTTGLCLAILLIVHGVLLRIGLVDADIVARGATTVAIAYISMVTIVYVELVLNKLKEYMMRRIEECCEQPADAPDEP